MKTYNGNIVRREEGDFYAEVWVEGNLLSYPLSKPVVEAKGNVDFQLIGGEAVVVNHVNYKIEEYLFDWIASSGTYNPPFNTDDLLEFAAYCLEQRDKEIGWRAYPKNKPDKIGSYLVMREGYDEVGFDWWASDMFVDHTDIIAFMPISKYKP